MNKKENMVEDLISGGTTLSIGATAVSALPASAAQAGVTGGLGAAGSFFPVMGAIGGASMAMKQVRNLKNSNKDFCYGDEDCKTQKRESRSCPTGGIESRRNARRFF